MSRKYAGISGANPIIISKYIYPFSDYMLALNAKNFKANIYVWTGLTGTVDIFGYIVSIFILKWSTRRLSQFSLFALAGAFLLIVFAVPKDIMYLDYVLLTFAMMSRFCITSVYAIMTLHTAVSYLMMHLKCVKYVNI